MFQSMLETGLRQTMQRLVSPMLDARIPIPLQRVLIRQAYRSSRPPRGCHVEAVTYRQVPASRVTYGAPGTGALIYLHGGGYVIGSASTHAGIAGHLAKGTGLPVIVPDYRLAPEHPYPAALDDAQAVYLALLEQGCAPAEIALAGDSAGGGLALALAMRLRGGGYPLPGSVCLFSPWTDLTNAQLYRPDCEPILNRAWIDKSARLYAGSHSLTTPEISPVYGDLSGLPPLLVQVGSQEILLNDAQRLAARAKAQGVETVLEIYNDLWHVFQVHAGQLDRATNALAVASAHILKGQTS